MALVLVEGEDRFPAQLESTNMTGSANPSNNLTSSSATAVPSSSSAYLLAPGLQLLEAAVFSALSVLLM